MNGLIDSCNYIYHSVGAGRSGGIGDRTSQVAYWISHTVYSERGTYTNAKI